MSLLTVRVRSLTALGVDYLAAPSFTFCHVNVPTVVAACSCGAVALPLCGGQLSIRFLHRPQLRASSNADDRQPSSSDHGGPDACCQECILPVPSTCDRLVEQLLEGYRVYRLGLGLAVPVFFWYM